MAQQQLCDNEDGQLAIILIHSIQTGDVEGYCGECWPKFVLAFAGALGWTPPAPPAPTAGELDMTAGGELPGEGRTPGDDEADEDDDTDRDDHGGQADDLLMAGAADARPNGQAPARKRAPRKAAPRARRAGAR
jgi:hypothetical protein